MQTRSPKYRAPSLLYDNLLDQINPKHPLVILSKKIPWEEFDKTFEINILIIDGHLNLLD